MATKGDTVFYAGYGSVVIILGIVIFLFSFGLFDAWLAFGFWLLFTSLVLIGLGTIGTEEAPQGSKALVGTGLVFTLISVAMLGIMTGMLDPLSAFALFILLIGLGILGLGLMRGKRGE